MSNTFILSKTRSINPKHIVSSELILSDFRKFDDSGVVNTAVILLNLSVGNQIVVTTENIIIDKAKDALVIYDPELFDALKSFFSYVV